MTPFVMIVLRRYQTNGHATITGTYIHGCMSLRSRTNHKGQGQMSNPTLKQAIEDRHKEIIVSLLYQSQDDCLEDYLLDLEYYSNVKTFKQICFCNGNDYKQEIKELKSLINQ